MSTILITGATGTIGTKLVALLAAQAGVTVRAAVHTASAVPDRVTTVDFAFDQPELIAAAVRGVDKLFLLAPANADQVGASTRLIEAAVHAGVRHVVKLSALDCDVEPTIAYGRAHRDVERVLARSPIAWTNLRPNNFMENTLGGRHGAFAPDARGEIRMPFGDATCSFVAADDIAAASARVLLEDGHAGKHYDLTGPESLGIAELARVIGAVSGRSIRYLDVAEADARRTMSRMPPPVVDDLLELYALGKSGRAARVSTAIEQLTGRPPRSFDAFARDHARHWSAS